MEEALIFNQLLKRAGKFLKRHWRKADKVLFGR